MKIKFSFKGIKKEVDVKKCNFFRKGFGLMFRSSNTDNLFFDFHNDKNRAITSYFVFFPFVAVWLDEKNKVLERRVVFPFTTTIYCKKPFRKLIELPINSNNFRIINFLVGKKGLNR